MLSSSISKFFLFIFRMFGQVTLQFTVCVIVHNLDNASCEQTGLYENHAVIIRIGVDPSITILQV